MKLPLVPLPYNPAPNFRLQQMACGLIDRTMFATMGHSPMADPSWMAAWWPTSLLETELRSLSVDS